MRPELVLPRTISAPAGAAPVGFRPWLEVAARVRVQVAGWGLAEETWAHWAMPIVAGQPVQKETVQFDPGRRAASPGEPPAELRLGDAALDEATGGWLCEALLSAWRPRIHYNTVLRLVSRLDEPVETFRRWCASLVARGPRFRKGSASERGAMDRLAEGVETRILSGGEIEVLHLRVGIGWYPEGIDPALGWGDRP